MTFVFFLQMLSTQLLIFMTLDVKNLILFLGDLDLTSTRPYYTDYSYFVNASFSVNPFQTQAILV